MSIHQQGRSRRRSVWLSPYLLVVALSPALLQTASPLSCRTGDTRLSELAVIVDNDDQIVFHPGNREYSVRLTPGADTALVRAFPTDPSAQVWVNVFADSGHYNAMARAVGGGEATIPLELGMNTLRVLVRAPGGASDFYEVAISVGSTFSCTELGIRNAIAEGGGVHRFACGGPTTIVTESVIDINNDVILDGQGVVNLDGGNDHRLFTVSPGVTAGLRGFSLRRGRGGGGGAIFNGGTLTLIATTVSDNVAISSPIPIDHDGGGIYNAETLELVDSIISGNSSRHGGGIAQLPGTSLQVIRTRISDNVAIDGGGAIYNWAGWMEIEDSVIESNNAQYGGGIYQVSSGAWEVSTAIMGTRISGNTSSWRAGGIYAEGDFTVSESTIVGNTAGEFGGGIYCNVGNPVGTSLNVAESTIDGNTADASGGGIYCNAGPVEISSSTISRNTSGGDGGGAYFRASSDARFTNSTVSGNLANGLGGGVASQGEVEFVSSTVAENSSDETDEASALFIAGSARLLVHNSIVSGSCVYCGWAEPPNVVVCAPGPSLMASGVNVEGPGDTCHFDQEGDLVNVTTEALGLQPLADNGGLTRTHGLSSDSVGVDAISEADCADAARSILATDQRGATRPPFGMCDVGAFEVQPPETDVHRVPSEYESIQAAINTAALQGDTVLVAPGIYVENLHFQGKNVIVLSERGPLETVIDANQGTGVIMGQGSALLGFTVMNAKAFSGAAVTTGFGGAFIRDNIFEGNTSSSYGAAIGGNTTAPVIERNLFRNNRCDDDRFGSVVGFSNVSSSRISNNVFENNDCAALNMRLPATARPRVNHNTIVGNAIGVRVKSQVDTTLQLFQDNIISGNEIGVEVEAPSGPTWERNLVFGNGTDYLWETDPTGTAGNLSVDPLFVDQSGGDYHLLPGSPAIDSALNPPFSWFDFDGRARTVDGDRNGGLFSDIGAYEAPAP